VAPVLLLCAAILSATIAFAQGGHADAPPPLVDPPRNASDLHDAVTKLVRRLDAGTTTLPFDAQRGFLPAVLRELQLPVSSQVLVFSKTSLQYMSITPQTPRAIYFNDDVYAGFVPDGRLIELSAVDPEIGPVFYTLTQSPAARPHLVTNTDCIQCHAIPATMSLPGYLVRSVFARPDGQVAPRVRSFLTDHRSPMHERWGGWYVSGTFGGDMHMGNAVLREGQEEADFDRAPGTRMASVASHFRSERYPAGESDVVALMVLEHQTRMHNLIAKLHYDSARALPLDADIEEWLRYALFVDEAPLNGPVAGPTTFAADFERRGPEDSRGRSLRQFDLHARLFRYPCSYLIYSDAFLALPMSVKQQIYRRLDDILADRDTDPAFAKLTPGDRGAILEILRATHREFAAAVAGLNG
jgi:hypothetical protein